MTLRPRPATPRDLTRVGLVLAPRPRRHGRLLAATLTGLAVGVGATLALPHLQPLSPAAADGLAEPPELAQWRDQAEQRRLALELAEARAQALERQIDTLNQQLRETREELTFFRQARDPKR